MMMMMVMMMMNGVWLECRGLAWGRPAADATMVRWWSTQVHRKRTLFCITTGELSRFGRHLPPAVLFTASSQGRARRLYVRGCESECKV